MKRMYFWTLLVVLLDQITKSLLRGAVPINTSKPVIGELLRWTHVQNPGAGFSLSLGSDSFDRAVFIAINILAGILLGWLIWKSRDKIEALCFALILGGDIGNLVDRFRLGGVTDFIDCDFPDFLMRRWPIFNVADSSIVVALVIFFIYSLFFEKKVGTHLPEDS
jgi:signal peptidase II